MPIAANPENNAARALWIERPRQAALRSACVGEPGAGEARIAMLWSGISRGTERLVFEGRVPAAQAKSMRAPFQDGEFPFPVKYGYCAVGRVEAGPAEWLGRTVFCLHPHQSRFIVPLDMARPVPENVPPRRATLAANMETALNALWDFGAGPGDGIVVIGAGVVGLLVAALCAGLPGADVTVVDIDATRAKIAASWRDIVAAADFAAFGYDDASRVHASASAQGLALALGCAGLEANIVEMSWYGDAPVAAPLGGAFRRQALAADLVAGRAGVAVPPPALEFLAASRQSARTARRRAV